MKALIDRILRSAQRLQEFFELAMQDEDSAPAVKVAYRRETRLHLCHSIKLYFRSLFGIK